MDQERDIRPAAPQELIARYRAVRAHSLALAAPLSAEDQQLQSMPDASPTKWHLAHTSWFFETLVLCPHAAGYAVFDAGFAYLFNSYYEALGPRHPRPQRGMLSRPSADAVRAYRQHVDAAMQRFLANADPRRDADALAIVELGLQHEQQHQELILTDIKHALSLNPLAPAYAPSAPRPVTAAAPQRWLDFDGGIVDIGHDGDAFHFDNEAPRHPVLLQPYRLAQRPVSCGEYLAFIEDGGYRRPEFWLSEGWATVQAQDWCAPGYWQAHDGAWRQFTLYGLRDIDPAEPVCHVSAYEAAAFAAWAGARLPTEFEWEAAVQHSAAPAQAQTAPLLHPRPAPGDDDARLHQLHDAVWQWTASAYAPYPGFRALPGPAAEYNGKFMINQLVLRGGSCATPPGHARPSYRNFFPPHARWQFSGIRLAKDPA